MKYHINGISPSKDSIRLIIIPLRTKRIKEVSSLTCDKVSKVAHLSPWGLVICNVLLNQVGLVVHFNRCQLFMSWCWRSCQFTDMSISWWSFTAYHIHLCVPCCRVDLNQVTITSPFGLFLPCASFVVVSCLFSSHRVEPFFFLCGYVPHLPCFVLSCV